MLLVCSVIKVPTLSKSCVAFSTTPWSPSTSISSSTSTTPVRSPTCNTACYVTSGMACFTANTSDQDPAETWWANMSCHAQTT